jgi:hypothetical protein
MPHDFVLLDNWTHLNPVTELARLPRDSIIDAVIGDETGNEVADQLLRDILRDIRRLSRGSLSWSLQTGSLTWHVALVDLGGRCVNRLPLLQRLWSQAAA